MISAPVFEMGRPASCYKTTREPAEGGESKGKFRMPGKHPQNEGKTLMELLQSLETVSTYQDFLEKYPDGPVKQKLIELRDEINKLPDEIAKAAEANSLKWSFDDIARSVDRILSASLNTVTQVAQSLDGQATALAEKIVADKIASGELLPKEKHLTLCSEASTAAADAAVKQTEERLHQEAVTAAETAKVAAARVQVLQSLGIAEEVPAALLALPEEQFTAEKAKLETRLARAKEIGVAEKLPKGRIFCSDPEWTAYDEALALGRAAAGKAGVKAPLSVPRAEKPDPSKKPVARF